MSWLNFYFISNHLTVNTAKLWLFSNKQSSKSYFRKFSIHTSTTGMSLYPCSCSIHFRRGKLHFNPSSLMANVPHFYHISLILISIQFKSPNLYQKGAWNNNKTTIQGASPSFILGYYTHHYYTNNDIDNNLYNPFHFALLFWTI